LANAVSKSWPSFVVASVRDRGKLFRPWIYRREGLSNLHYELVNVTMMSLYVNVSVILPPPSDATKLY